MFKPGYIGGKAAAGVFHRIIGEMPPHSLYLEPFFGSGAVFWNKRRAPSSIVIDRDPEVIARIGDVAGVSALCGDALAIVPTLTLPSDAVAYFDPPYPLGTRNGRSYYKHELSDDDHERLIAMILKLPGRVLVSSYANPLYMDRLRDWRCCRYAGVTRGGAKTEMLWCNFDSPVDLHDWRYAGRTYRERLYLRRLAARTLARLEAMPARKRGYLLNALAESGVACRQLAPDLALGSRSVDSGADGRQSGAYRSNLVLSMFPGIDLLGRGFEAEGYNIVRGPDSLWGQDVRDYTPPCHVFEGIVGGPLCQKFSTANRTNRDVDAGLELVREFARCIVAAQPLWFVMENVPGVPDLEIPGYRVQRFNLNALECGLKQNRIRVFQFGCRDRSVLVIPRSKNSAVESQPACLATEAYRSGARQWPDFCELQGLPRDFVLPGWSKAAKYRAVGNGVPIPMAVVPLPWWPWQGAARCGATSPPRRSCARAVPGRASGGRGCGRRGA